MLGLPSLLEMDKGPARITGLLARSSLSLLAQPCLDGLRCFASRCHCCCVSLFSRSCSASSLPKRDLATGGEATEVVAERAKSTAREHRLGLPRLAVWRPMYLVGRAGAHQVDLLPLAASELRREARVGRRVRDRPRFGSAESSSESCVPRSVPGCRAATDARTASDPAPFDPAAAVPSDSIGDSTYSSSLPSSSLPPFLLLGLSFAALTLTMRL